MARRLRGQAPKADRIQPRDRNVAGLTYAGTQLRAHCPMCGMMANIERFSDGAHEVDTYTQYYGGSIRQYYEEAPQYQEQAMRLMLDQLDDIRAYLLDSLGEPEPEEPAERASRRRREVSPMTQPIDEEDLETLDEDQLTYELDAFDDEEFEEGPDELDDSEEVEEDDEDTL